ncbi:SprB repeat-containing protein [Hymenobacter sp. 5317J-9]|uniref:SprB repeat-containing protein n=1 Tax=Hymenobacter sp. 5317J-9 TaxID=2932250 RepID=UPI001FD6CBE8|nr:SprB repeat-containing protein [Hymenobacter sp. 5317J-9]UOQ99913.1 SprB repeat-containing protein [Hymenobacter sp. 5317J-9]
MLKLLKLDWTSTGTYGDRSDQVYGERFAADKYEFDTTTRTVVHTPFPLGGDYDYDQSSGSTIGPPENYSRDVLEEFHVYVNGPTRTGYFHDGNGGFTTAVTTLTLTATTTQCPCFGTNTGGIDLTVAGMNGPFTYRWDDGPTTEDRGLVPAGTYRVAVTDVPSGAVARATVQVGTNPELVVVIQKTGADVALQVSGGTGLYTFLWDDGVTTRDRTGLSDGPHSCVITDVLGCSKEINLVVTSDVFFWSRNPITLALDAGAAYRADPTTKPNLTFLCEVWVEKDYLSGAFELVGGVLEQPADRDGRTVFQVETLLDVFLQHHVPAVGLSGVVRADPMFRRFYLKYAESYGTPPVRSGTSVLTQNYVVLGGLNFYESRARTFFDRYQGAVMPFLTWEPPAKTVVADQPEFLYYLVSKSTAGFRFQLRVQYTDGTNEVINLGGVDNVRLHEVYCRPVGYEALQLAAIAESAGADKVVLWWEIFVTTPDEATALSEVRRYELDRKTYPKRRFFLFATSLGGMATYAALGEAQVVDVELTGEESSRTLTPDSDPLDGDTAVRTRALRPVMKVASGKRSRAQMEASQDFLLSRRVLLQHGLRWLPGFVKAKTSTLLDESKPVPTQDFEFYLTTEQLYTPELGDAQFTYAQPAL